MQHLVEKHAESPNISFGSIHILKQTLGSHVRRWAYTGIFELTFTSGCKSKIPNFSPTPVNKNISRLDIPMHDTNGLKVQQPMEDIFNIVIGFL